MLDISAKSRVRVFFKVKNDFWGKPQYFEKELIFSSSTSSDDVKRIVKETFPKFLYYIHKGQVIKNNSGEQSGK
jgi:hypothetical protein